MKYVVLIHSNPQPWGHPTGDYLPEFQALPEAERERMGADFEALLGEMREKGELVTGEALGAPESARLYRWGMGNHWLPMGRIRRPRSIWRGSSSSMSRIR
ncbi:hypothetical protein [Nocardia terpenica]|uniref:hypothetical protein n=1 Tax=Nocardia terpenica TaxID=455432 RepID=UPI001EECEE6E|nr:hypothetical protein [Nocardia terpenica]